MSEMNNPLLLPYSPCPACNKSVVMAFVKHHRHIVLLEPLGQTVTVKSTGKHFVTAEYSYDELVMVIHKCEWLGPADSPIQAPTSVALGGASALAEDDVPSGSGNEVGEGEGE